MNIPHSCQHGTKVKKALQKLRQKDNLLEIIDFALEYRENTISLIGIKDIDPERNLGDYQNISYFLLSENTRPVVIDPGLRKADWIKEILGIEECDVIITHFHLDHWIGYAPYKGQSFYASPICRTVLSDMVGIERTGKSIFFEGRLTDYHRRSTPVRAVNDAEKLLPINEKINEITVDKHYENKELALKFFELPYGQTEGTLYGVLQTPHLKVLFASDLFVIINNVLKIEPHYAFKAKEMVVKDITVALRALLGMKTDAPPEFQKNLKKLCCPDKIVLGHGILDFSTYNKKIEHLLSELEELRRIEREHII